MNMLFLNEDPVKPRAKWPFRRIVKDTPSAQDPPEPGREAAAREGTRAPRDAARPPSPEPPRFRGGQATRAYPSVTPPAAADNAKASPEAELLSNLAGLRQRFRDVAAVVEGLGVLRSLGAEEALIEMALFAQNHEQTL